MIAVNIVILNAPALITAAQEAMKVYAAMQQAKTTPTTEAPSAPVLIEGQSLTV